MTHRRRWRRMALLVLALALVAATCDGQDGDGTAAGGTEAPTEDHTERDEVFSVHLTEPETLVPANTSGQQGGDVLRVLFSPLVTHDPDRDDPLLGDEDPRAVAASVTSEDRRTWTITLKDGFTFHDGTPVTAQSYVDAWNHAAYEPNLQFRDYLFDDVEGYGDLRCGITSEGEPDCAGSPPQADTLSGLQVVDERTFTVTLTEPFSQFPLRLNHVALSPLPEAFYADPAAFNERPIGNGPFRMDGDWEHNEAIRVVAYTDHPAPPAAAGIEFRITANLEAAYDDLLAGDLDILGTLPTAEIKQAPETFGERFVSGPGSTQQYLGLPLYDSRFERVALRRAISRAIDRDAIADAVTPQYLPAYSVVAPVAAGARDNPCGEHCAYDPEAARALFEAAGGFEGPLTLWYNAGQNHEVWLEAVANQLRENLGIAEVEFTELPFAEYLQILDNREITGPYRLGWIMDYPSPQNYLEPLFASDGSSNNSGYSDPRVDTLIREGNEAASLAESIASYQEAEDRILADLPHIPLFFDHVAAAHSEYVTDVETDGLMHLRLADVRVVAGTGQD